MKLRKAAMLLALTALAGPGLAREPRASTDKLMAHNDPGHSGWNAHETILTPSSVAGGKFGPIWSSPQLDGYADQPPRAFSAPLVMNSVRMTGGDYRGQSFSVAFITTTAGYAYAINIAAKPSVPAGTILWRTRFNESPCLNGNNGPIGNYGTGIIDPTSGRIYFTGCTDDLWSAYALDIHSGKPVPGWPVNISRTMMDQPALNRNGTRTWRLGKDCRWLQRGALNLSADGKRLYVAFGADGVGWMTVLDTVARKVASAFSATPDDEQDGGGMWAAGGPPVDAQGRIYITTGSNLQNGIKLGLAGIYAESENSWAHSILQFKDDRTEGLKLTGTYTPYNYCQAAKADIDIGSSAAIVLDLPAETTSTPHLLLLGGGKQGNIYLLDRDHMPGGVDKRHPCTLDPADDMSLLAPEVQPEWKRRGPISLFKPFSDEIGAFDQAKSRTTASYYRDESGTTFVYVTGSSKKGENFSTSTPPGLAKVRIVTSPGKPAHLKVDTLEMTQTLHNPWSPIITSNGGRDAVIWVFDQNAPRTARLYGENPPKPLLYAFDADLKLLWKSAPGALFTSGNYVEPTPVNGMVLVATDRLQAFGLKK